MEININLELERLIEETEVDGINGETDSETQSQKVRKQRVRKFTCSEKA